MTEQHAGEQQSTARGQVGAGVTILAGLSVTGIALLLMGVNSIVVITAIVPTSAIGAMLMFRGQQRQHEQRTERRAEERHSALTGLLGPVLTRQDATEGRVTILEEQMAEVRGTLTALTTGNVVMMDDAKAVHVIRQRLNGDG